MALRVLLADESSTIKKVMQLALQDFGVEVKAVPIGLDVMQVVKAWKPEIIFADVLLSKRTGYEVCADLKNDPETANIPVILMWSGFMELDENKALECRADKRLEKPFDADHLRALVKSCVGRLGDNKISDYLTFPDLPPIVESPKEQAQKKDRMAQEQNQPTVIISTQSQPESATRASAEAPQFEPLRTELTLKPESTPSTANHPIPRLTEKTSLSHPGFEEIAMDLEEPDDFQQVPLPGARTAQYFETPRDDEDWRQGGLEQFRVNPNLFTMPTEEELIELGAAPISIQGLEQDVPIDGIGKAAPIQSKAPTAHGASQIEAPAPAGMGVLDPIRVEEILRDQVREVIEGIAWKIIPDIVERVVREEIDRLLKEAERL